MGNNESLPPPPPPGQPPVPPAPPAGPPAYQPPPPPGFNPVGEQFPPTTQFPATQQFPPTQAFPGGPPGGFPPNGSTAFEQPAEPPKKKTGLIVAGGLIAVAVIVAVVLVLTGGDDKAVTPATTISVITVPVTLPDITFPPDDTLGITIPVITEPVVTDPAITDPPVTEPVVQTTILSGGAITDDLGVFTMVLPDGLAVDTTPITTKDNFTLPSIAGAVDLQGFYNDDVTPGMTSVVVGEDANSTPADVLTFLEPGDGVCTGREQIADFPTALGPTVLLKLDGCGDGGVAAKVILVITIPGSTSIAALYVQGPGTSADLLPQAQPVFESIRLL